MKKQTQKVKKVKVRRAKLVSNGGLYRFIPLEEVRAQLILPVMRRIKLTEPEIDYTETWHFQLVFGLLRVLKGYAEYQQIDCIKVEIPPKSPSKTKMI